MDTTRAELLKVKHESEQKYASAFEEARVCISSESSVGCSRIQALASQENVQDLIILREELTATHTSLVESQQAEIDSIHNKHSMTLADLAADHQTTLGDVGEKLHEAQAALSAARERQQELENQLATAATENEEIRFKLEDALHQAGGSESKSKADLEEARERASELQRELADIKDVRTPLTLARANDQKHETDQSQLRASMESLQDEHNTTLRQHAGHAAGKMEVMRSEHAEEISKLKLQIDSLRRMLNVSAAYFSGV
jgi:chromosome segregation ATPase